MKNNSFLDVSVIRQLRNTVQENSFLNKENVYRPYINLIYAIMDRIDSCVNYLNSHVRFPKSETDFLFFFMLGCIINDAVPQFFKTLKNVPAEMTSDVPLSGGLRVFFKETCERNNLKNVRGSEIGEIPTDDEFFQHIRSLIFAHPFETSRSKVIPEKKKLFSPFVMISNLDFLDKSHKNDVAIRVYSDDIKQERFIFISFAAIKAFIKYKYEQISMITEWINKQKTIIHNHWKKRKVNRNLSPAEILLDVRAVCKERHFDYLGAVEDLYSFLTCPVTNIKRNKKSVDVYRNAIIETIPLICDAVDSIDEERVYSLFEKVIFPRDLKITFPSFDYFVSKILCADDYMFDVGAKVFASETESWGWVRFNFEKMDVDEVRLLASASCYLQKQKEISK